MLKGKLEKLTIWQKAGLGLATVIVIIMTVGGGLWLKVEIDTWWHNNIWVPFLDGKKEQGYYKEQECEIEQGYYGDLDMNDPMECTLALYMKKYGDFYILTAKEKGNYEDWDPDEKLDWYIEKYKTL